MSSGIASFLAGIRLIFNTPPSKLLLKALSKGVEYNDKKSTLLVEAINCMVGYNCSCLSTRFYAGLLRIILSIIVKMLGGDLNKSLESLRDPAVRRGLNLVISGLGIYGLTVPQKFPAPFLIVWNFTNVCNLRCQHCYQNAGAKLENELTFNEKLKVLDMLDHAGVAAIAFSGGEPTIHEDFIKILTETSSRGIYTALATNGWRLADPSYTRKLKRAGLRYVEISIDSTDPYKHDKFRGVKGSWYRAVKGVKNAVREGISVGIATTITRFNIDEVDEMICFAEELGANRMVFFNFIPVGRGIRMIDYDIEPEERERLLAKLYFENTRRDIEIYSTAPQFARVSCILSSGRDVAATHFYVKGDPVISSLAEYIGGCGAGRIYAAIQPDGSVTPCVFIPDIVVGNLRDTHFVRIWNNSRVFKVLRDRNNLKGNCRECPYRYICGGCRARALAYTGDITGPDPGCIRNRDLWIKLKDKDIKNAQVIKSIHSVV